MSKVKRPNFGVPAPDFALHDPATALSSIFRPVCRGRRPKGLDITNTFAGLSLRFTCFEWLDVRDQSVLLGAIGLAGISSETLDKGSSGPIGKQLWLDLKPEDRAVDDVTVTFKTSYYQLLDAAGGTQSGQQHYEALKDALYRLSQVGCRAKTNGYDWSMRLLSYSANDNDKTVRIALNTRFAAAFAGQHINISLEERNTLKGEISALVHCWLSAWCREGQCGKIGTDKLVAKIWGNETLNDGTARTRRKRLSDALIEIGELPGWTVKFTGRGGTAMVLIWRSKERIKPVRDDLTPLLPGIENTG